MDGTRLSNCCPLLGSPQILPYRLSLFRQTDVRRFDNLTAASLRPTPLQSLTPRQPVHSEDRRIHLAAVGQQLTTESPVVT